jgi:hypothetical protein
MLAILLEIFIVIKLPDVGRTQAVAIAQALKILPRRLNNVNAFSLIHGVSLQNLSPEYHFR